MELLFRRKKKGRGVPLDQQKPVAEKLLLPKKVEGLEDIFLKVVEQEPDHKSPFDDFLQVKKNEKRSG